MAEYLRASGDYLRNGTEQSAPGNQAVCTPLFAGQADMGNYWYNLEQTLGTKRVMLGNTSTVSSVNNGIDDSAQSGAFDYTMQQFFFGRGIATITQYRSFSSSWLPGYQKVTSTARKGQGVLTAQYEAGDWAMMRRDLCFTLIFGNSYFMGAITSGGTGDYCDPNNSATWPQFDEMVGGALQTGGYLGAPVSGAAGLPQTVAWNGSIYRRDFTNGIVLINMGTTATSSYNLGATFYHLRSAYGSQSINNAAAVSTSFSLGTISYAFANSSYPSQAAQTMGDACVLYRTAT
jgi:hypothetical protein